MWFSSTEEGQESSASSAGVGHHLQHHGVGRGDERSRPKGSTEAAQLLHSVRVTVIHVHIVVSTRGVSLQVKNPELDHDHLALWDLRKRKLLTASSRQNINIAFRR